MSDARANVTGCLDDAQRFAESARLLLPSLAVAMARCLREGRDPASLLQAIARCGQYIEAKKGDNDATIP